MRVLLYGLLSLLFAFGQSSSFYLEPFLGGAFPHISLLLILFVALLRGPALGVFVAILSGIVFDLTSILPLGFHVAIFSTLAYVLGTFRSLILLDRVIGPVLLAVVSYVAFLLLVLGLGTIYNQEGMTTVFRTETFLEMFYTSLMSPLIYNLTLFFETLLRKRPGGRYK